MGWDICSIGKHTLETSNVESLAIQLSQLLKCNISYGCNFCIKYDEKSELVIRNKKLQNSFVELGIIKYPRSRKTYQLIDRLYYEKEIFRFSKGNLKKLKLKFQKNDSVESNQFFIYLVKSALKEVTQNNSKYELIINKSWEHCKLYQPLYIDILKECISFNIKEPFQWFQFVRNFTKEYTKVGRNHLAKYRNGLYKIASKLLVNKIIYFSDQGPTQMILDEMWSGEWDGVMEYIKSKKYIDDFCKANKYKSKQLKSYDNKVLNDKEKYLQINVSEVLKNNILFNSENFLQVLFDDFKDL